MPQVTLYVDEETDRRMRAAAQRAGVSLSRWIRDLIRGKTANEWPESVANLAGAWADYAEDRKSDTDDVPREPL